MYVDRIRHKQPNGKVYTQYLLRTSHREGAKTIKTTILNITQWGAEACEAIAFALKNKKDISRFICVDQNTNRKIDPPKRNSKFAIKKRKSLPPQK
ncbi:MAG: hypothetical protein LBP59_04625 [Planctomycetaceae bacterium]|jgi:hypothetical protein|nr:hypothetical protein [Planctomycetaceae bacterium]